MSEIEDKSGPEGTAEAAGDDGAVQAEETFNFRQIWQQISTGSMKGFSYNGDTEGGHFISGGGESGDKFPVSVLGEVYWDGSERQEFEAAIHSKIWFTYRTGFEPIPKAADGPQPLSFVRSMLFNRNPISSTLNNIHGLIDNENFTTDVGWGCMIRTSQSLLANAYLKLLCGKKGDGGEKDGYENNKFNESNHRIINMFKDEPGAPFSIHNFIRVASELPLQVKPGQWFGPNAASLSIKRLCSQELVTSNLPAIEVLVSESCDLYDDRISTLFTRGHKIEAILVLLPVRLGVDKVSPYYHESINQIFSFEQSVGIAGGKPSSSYYFFGENGQDLLYLDPHYPQFCWPNLSPYASFHTNNYQELNVSDMDPSMMIGIVIRSMEDYENFKSECTKRKNKILHFHTVSDDLDLHGSVSSKGKPFEYVDCAMSDDQTDEDFVTLQREARESLHDRDEYVDIAAEWDQSYIEEDEEEENQARQEKQEKQDKVHEADKV